MRSNPFILDKTYDETFALLMETRGYIKNILPIVREEMDLAIRIKTTYQSSRLTSRLLEMVSWLMAQKAIHNREMTRQESIAQGFIISNDSVCMIEKDEQCEELPQGLRDLLGRSAALYERLMRLDTMVKQAA